MERAKENNIFLRVSDDTLNHLDYICKFNGYNKTQMITNLIELEYAKNIGNVDAIQNQINEMSHDIELFQKQLNGLSIKFDKAIEEKKQ